MKRYDSYKDSGVDWIGEIPNHWDNLNLGNIFTVSGRIGWKNLRSDEYVEEPNYIFLSTPNLKSKEIDFVNVNYITKERYEESPEIMLELDNILLVKSGSTLGIVNIIRELPRPTTVNGSSVVLKKRNKPEIGVFYNYLLSSDYFQNLMKITQGGVGVPSVNQSDIRKFKIIKPPLSEQQQIVFYLDSKTSQIDELIEKKERKIELLKKYRITLINQVVTKGLNPIVEMKDSGVEWIGEIPSSWDLRKGSTLGHYSKGNGIRKDEVKEEGFPCIRYGEIYTKYNHKVLEVHTFVDKGVTEVKVGKGTLLMTGSGELLEDIGKCVVYIGEEEILVGGDIIILQPNPNFNSEFLSYLINSESVRIQRELNGRGGIIVHIYSKNYKDMWFPTPPLPEQQQIVNYLDEQTSKIDSSVQIEKKKIELLKEYRQSLISSVVTGKIDVRTN